MQNKRKDTLSNYLNSCNTKAWHDKAYQPVISTTPSYNEDNWGYTETSCGIGDRTGQPGYNEDHLSGEWELNLDDALSFSPENAWLYIQAYDEWGEGSTIAPNTKTCSKFLEVLKSKLFQYNWLSDNTDYCRPDWPENNIPEICEEKQDDEVLPDADVMNDEGLVDDTDLESFDEMDDDENDMDLMNEEEIVDTDNHNNVDENIENNDKTETPDLSNDGKKDTENDDADKMETTTDKTACSMLFI
jgi:hypothetical protein